MVSSRKSNSIASISYICVPLRFGFIIETTDADNEDKCIIFLFNQKYISYY